VRRRRPGRAVVVGGANVDVKARSTGPALPGTSNPGTALTTPGGVARNVAENLARLGTPVALVAAVGSDPLGDLLLGETAAAGVDVAAVRRDAPRTGSYTAVLDSDGELLVAVADMAATDAMAPADLTAALGPLLPGADLLVVDTNLAAPALHTLLALSGDARVPVVLDPVSVPKAARVPHDLRGVLCVTPNGEELGALATSGATGTASSPQPAASPDAAAARLHRRGVRHVWTHLGTGGSVLRTAGEAAVTVPAAPVTTVLDVTGAGDALVAAFCHGLLTGLAPVAAAALGHRAAALTVADPRTVRPDLATLLEETA
jgi:pseudouridine kinase